jgi:hypothetical protein
MIKKTKSYLLIVFISIIAILVLGYCLFWIGIFYEHISPFFMNGINKIDWFFIIMFSITLLSWYLYFSILKSQVRFFTIVPEGKEITNRYSLFEFLVYVWLFSLMLSGFLYFLFKDNEHGIDYAVVSFFISAPYLTFKFVKYYVWEKKKIDLKN